MAATVSITQVNAEVVTTLEYNSKNKKFTEEVSISEVTDLAFTKAPADTVSLIDVAVTQFQLAIADIISITDSILELYGATLNASPINSHTLGAEGLGGAGVSSIEIVIS